jgi:hypothetical protein
VDDLFCWHYLFLFARRNDLQGVSGVSIRATTRTAIISIGIGIGIDGGDDKNGDYQNIIIERALRSFLAASITHNN